jgi:hypothetical protein
MEKHRLSQHTMLILLCKFSGITLVQRNDLKVFHSQEMLENSLITLVMSDKNQSVSLVALLLGTSHCS